MSRVIRYSLLLLLILAVAVAVFFIKNILSRDPDTVYELRGRYKPSPDGKTYLVVEDDNGGQCGPLLLDNTPWAYELNRKGAVSPGDHRIDCGAGIMFTVPEGATYYFDYWGP